MGSHLRKGGDGFDFDELMGVAQHGDAEKGARDNHDLFGLARHIS